MKILAILLNIGWLGFAITMSIKDGLPTGKDLPMVILLFAAPIVTLVAFFCGKDICVPFGLKWIHLWIQRKTAEEEQKLKEINSKMNR